MEEEIEKEIFVRLGACAQTRFSIRLISAITGFEEKDAITYLKRLEKNILSRKNYQVFTKSDLLPLKFIIKNFIIKYLIFYSSKSIFSLRNIILNK